VNVAEKESVDMLFETFYILAVTVWRNADFSVTSESYLVRARRHAKGQI
jgi:hypothetical protein